MKILVLMSVLNTSDPWDSTLEATFPDVDFGIEMAEDFMRKVNEKMLAEDGLSLETNEPYLKLVRGSDDITKQVVRVWADSGYNVMYRLERVSLFMPEEDDDLLPPEKEDTKPRKNEFVVREVKEKQVVAFIEDMKKPLNSVHRVISRYPDFNRSEWLGGEIDRSFTAVPPEEIRQIMGKLKQAHNLLKEADNEAVQYLGAMWNEEVSLGE